MKKTPMTLQEKRALKKKQEQQFTVISFVVVALTVLLSIGILVFIIARDGFTTTKLKTEDLYEFWYLDDGSACWNFRKDDTTETETDVYFFGRAKETEPYIFSAFTDVLVDEENGTVSIRYSAFKSVVYNCDITKDTLTLTSKDDVKVFKKGVALSKFNEEILEQYPPSSDKESA
jgi:hypothetical protein